MKILVTRTDRLGDLVLSLPVLDYLLAALPEIELHVLVAPGSVPVVECHPGIKRVWTWEPDDLCVRRDLLRAFRLENFQAALMLQYHQQLASLIKKAGIPRRCGPLSRFSSWFQLNRGVRQKRSRCQHHEMEYNLQLARKILPGAPDPGEPVIRLSEGQRENGRRFRQEEAAEAETVVFIHPGSGGSALDWEPIRFAGVANSLARLAGHAVFVTGAGQDARFVEAMAPSLRPEIQVLLDRFDLRTFLGVLSGGDLLVGPSTGPLHLAAALGLAVVGIYPPVPTMGPGRWGPRGKLARAVVPSVDCPSSRFCHGEKCPHHNCLNEVYERDVLDLALALVKQKQAARDIREDM